MSNASLVYVSPLLTLPSLLTARSQITTAMDNRLKRTLMNDEKKYTTHFYSLLQSQPYPLRLSFAQHPAATIPPLLSVFPSFLLFSVYIRISQVKRVFRNMFPYEMKSGENFFIVCFADHVSTRSYPIYLPVGGAIGGRGGIGKHTIIWFFVPSPLECLFPLFRFRMSSLPPCFASNPLPFVVL